MRTTTWIGISRRIARWIDRRRGALARHIAVLAALLGAGTMSAPAHSADGGLELQRKRMLDAIAADARETARHTGRAEFSARVMAAMGKVERHRFVPAEHARSAYDNRPLPIGHGQTISQPYIVALMTDVLDLSPTDRVLEIGTGSGYQAAVLAELVQAVYTIEIVVPLGEQAAALLGRLGYANVRTRIGDGYAGWPEAAPFDAIVVTAAPPTVPQALFDQLKPGGRMVVPVGPQNAVQELLVIRKQPDGTALTRATIPVRFVPMTRPK